MKTIFSFIVIFFFSFSLLVSAQGGECTLGLDEITINPGGVNAQTWVITGNQIYGRQVTAEKSGLVVGLGFITGTSSLSFKPAIYSDENNTPNVLLWSSGSVVGPSIPILSMDTAYASVTPFPVNFGDKLWPAIKWSGTGSRRLLHLPAAEGLSFQIGNPFVNAFHPDLSVMPGLIMQSGIYGIFLVIQDCQDPIAGCMTPTACNYNPQAQVSDGSCEYVSCLGCTNSTACNYDSTATIDDGSCIFSPLFYDCSGVCLNDSDNDGVCDELENPGCTHSLACNYDSTATSDDGSCIFAALFYDCSGLCLSDSDNDGVCDELEITGCTDTSACNYNHSATENDGSCLFGIPGCTDPLACNYDPLATCQAVDCVYTEFTNHYCLWQPANADCIFSTTCYTDADWEQIYSSGTSISYFMPYLPNVTEATLKIFYALPQDSGPFSIAVFVNGTQAVNYSTSGPVAIGGGFSCQNSYPKQFTLPVDLFDTPILPGQHYIQINITGISMLYGVTADINYIPAPVHGCTDPLACNYDPAVTCADSSCLYVLGCMDPLACNYEPTAQCDDATCEYLSCAVECPADLDSSGEISFGDLAVLFTQFGCNQTCSADLNGDGEVGFGDVLVLLASYGSVCP